MKIRVMIAVVLVSIISESGQAQTVTWVGNVPYINGEPFNGYRTDHADAYMAQLIQNSWVSGTCVSMPVGTAVLSKPTKFTTLRFADARQAPDSRSYLIIQDDAATWPVLVRIIPEDNSKPEMQQLLTLPKGRRITLAFDSLPQLEGTNFAVVITIAEDQNSATLTTYQGSYVARQKADVRITEIQ